MKKRGGGVSVDDNIGPCLIYDPVIYYVPLNNGMFIKGQRL